MKPNNWVIPLVVIGSLICFGMDFPQLYYTPDMPSLPVQDYRPVEQPDSVFFAFTSCYQGLTRYGYPGHSTMVKGVNDTCYIDFVLDNSSTTHRDIRYLTPQNWATPVIYRGFGDMQHNRVEKDTTGFGWAFSHWSTGSLELVKPDTIFAFYGYEPGYPRYSTFLLRYKIWNVPLGLRAVELKKTAQAPAWLSVVRLECPVYWYVEGNDVKDTINAYIELSGRAGERRQWTQALNWINLALAKEDSSLAVWNWKWQYYWWLTDTTNCLASIYRYISIYENNHDPLLDLRDSTLTEDEKYWANDNYKEAIYWKWIYETGTKHVPGW